MIQLVIKKLLCNVGLGVVGAYFKTIKIKMKPSQEGFIVFIDYVMHTSDIKLQQS